MDAAVCIGEFERDAGKAGGEIGQVNRPSRRCVAADDEERHARLRAGIAKMQQRAFGCRLGVVDDHGGRQRAISQRQFGGQVAGWDVAGAALGAPQTREMALA